MNSMSVTMIIVRLNMFETFEKFDYHLAVIIGNRRASMNHFVNVIFKPVVSVLLYGLP